MNINAIKLITPTRPLRKQAPKRLRSSQTETEKSDSLVLFDRSDVIDAEYEILEDEKENSRDKRSKTFFGFAPLFLLKGVFVSYYI